MTPKPHILRDWIKGQRLVTACGTAAHIYFISPYNNSTLRVVPTNKRLQLI